MKPVVDLGIIALLMFCAACGESSDGKRDGGSGGSSGSGGTDGGAGSAGQAQSCPVFSPTPGALPELDLAVLVPSEVFGVDLLGVVSGQVYFVDNDLLQRVPITGGTPQTLAPLSGVQARLWGTDVLLWAEPDSATGPFRVVTARSSDPSATTLLAENVPGLRHLLADATHAYWATSENAVYRVPLTGGTPQIFVSSAFPTGALLHAGYYWWFDHLVPVNAGLERIGLSGGTRERLVDVHFGGSMAGDSEAVYWGDGSLQALEKWSLATGRVRLDDGDPNFVAVDAGRVYWSDGFVSATVRSIRSDGTDSKRLLCGLRNPGRLFIQGAYLVVNTNDGIVRFNR